MDKEQGFSAVEAALALVIVGIISFTGWFVYNSQHQTDKILSASLRSSNSNAVPTKKTHDNTILPDKAVTETPTAAEKEEIRVASNVYLHRDSSSKFDRPQEETFISPSRTFAIQWFCAPVGVQSDCSQVWLKKTDSLWQGLGANIQLFDNDRIDLNKKYGWPLNFF